MHTPEVIDELSIVQNLVERIRRKLATMTSVLIVTDSARKLSSFRIPETLLCRDLRPPPPMQMSCISLRRLAMADASASPSQVLREFGCKHSAAFGRYGKVKRFNLIKQSKAVSSLNTWRTPTVSVCACNKIVNNS